ncbi:MAG: DUF4129 domain-containing protein [Actinomycetota bacterium]
MTSPGTGAPDGAPDPEASWRPARVVMTALLIAAVLVGLRGEIPPLGHQGPWGQYPVPTGLGLEAVLAALLAAVALRHRRAPATALLAARLRGVLRAVLGIGLAVIPLALLLTHLPRAHPRRRARPPLGPTPRRTPGSNPVRHAAGPVAHVPVGAILTGVAVAVLVAAIVVALIAARRRTGRPVAVTITDAADDQRQLREAVESGQAALRELGDARAAIVACYAAMEQELAGAGVARDAAETPDELLARAARAGLVRGAAAARLTALFYAARFSTHPVPPSSRDQARQALGELAASLTGPTPAGPTPAAHP